MMPQEIPDGRAAAFWAYGAPCTLLVGLWHDRTALPVALILLASATVSQISFFIVRKSAF